MKKNLAKVYSYTKTYTVRPNCTGFDCECSYLECMRNYRYYRTKMKHDSLPEYFCDVERYSGYHDVIDTRNISNLKYKWFKMNHFMRDSSLEFSYTDSNETDRVYSYEIFKFLAYVKKYSGYDISGVRDEFIKQCNWLAENEPDYVLNIGNFGDWFDNKLKEYEE